MTPLFIINKLYKNQLDRVAFLMRSSVGTLQNQYLRNDVTLMDDEEPEPKQQKEIIYKINKIVVEETPNKKEVETQIIENVKSFKNKNQQMKHKN